MKIDIHTYWYTKKGSSADIQLSTRSQVCEQKDHEKQTYTRNTDALGKVKQQRLMYIKWNSDYEVPVKEYHVEILGR